MPLDQRRCRHQAQSSDSGYDGIDPEDVEMLEDLIMAAIQQAKENATEMSEAEMQNL